MLALCVAGIVMAPVLFLIVRTLGEPEVLARVLRSSDSWSQLRRSVGLAMTVALCSMTLGTVLAWLTVRPHCPDWLKRLLTIVLCSTLAMPSYVLAFAFIAAFGMSGPLAGWLPVAFTARDAPFLSSCIVLTMCTYPYVLLTVRGALLRECGSLEEAALGLGASLMRAFRTVTLPRLAPSIAWGGMLAALYSLADFGAVALLGYETLTWGIYSRYDTLFGIDEARALCLMLAALTFMLIAAMWLVRPGNTLTGAFAPQPAQSVRLRGWSVAAAMIVMLPVIIGLALPMVTIVHWLTVGGRTFEMIMSMRSAAAMTLMLAIVAAIFISLLALPIASMHLGRRRTLGRVLTPLTLLGFALPGLVIAITLAGLALSFDEFIEWVFGLPMENRLYQSHFLLLLAYAVLFLPESVGPLRSSAVRVHPDQLDAAEQLRRTRLMNWWRIALPQLSPGLAAGAALVFATTAKELPATLLLAPPNVQSLATRLWSAMEEAFFTQAAAASLLLLIVAACGLALVLLIERLGRTE